MNIEEVKKSLHPIEVKVLQFLENTWKDHKRIAFESNLSEIEVLRGLGWLKNKGLVELKEEEKEYICLDENGKIYLKIGLPEVRIFNYLKERKEASVGDLKRDLELSDDEINAAIGILKRKDVIAIIKRENTLILRIVKEFTEFPEQKILEKIENCIEISKLTKEEREIIKNLLKRKNIIQKRKIKIFYAKLTKLGTKIKESSIEYKYIDVLTRDLIISGKWKDKEFRRFDITLPTKAAKLGKKHPYLKYLEYVRKYLLSLGFEEMKGPIVLPSFWNMDALFVPQDHPSREIHDVFFVKDPKYSEDVPSQIFEKVRKEHVKAWRHWNDDFAKRLVLRSQVTALSALTMYRGVKIPGKYFAIERVFRPDTIDAKHFIEFRQLEGIVVDESLTFRELLGLLETIGKKLTGADKVRFYPGYFPFTEPSVELYVKHPKLGWMEIGGAGMFREELLRPFGIEVPVIAWGLGIDRMVMIALGIDDIRMLWTKDLKWLKEKEIPFI